MLYGWDRTDPGDLEDFVKWLFNLCLWVFFIGTSIIMIAAIFKMGDGGLPPEPQWWIDLEAALGITW
jgi:hypothetical protein